MGIFGKQEEAGLYGWCGICENGIYEEHGQTVQMGERCGYGTHARKFGRSPSNQRESLLRIKSCEVGYHVTDMMGQHLRKAHSLLRFSLVVKDHTILHFMSQNSNNMRHLRCQNNFALP